MVKNLVLLGGSTTSANRGVNALAYGAIEVLASNYPTLEKVKIVSRGSRFKNEIIKAAGRNIEVELVSFHSIWFLISFFISLLNKIIPFYNFKTAMINEINSGEAVFDINEGDSFSDIYGYERFMRHFIDSFIALSLHKEVTFLPQTIGPFSKPLVKFLGGYLLKKLTNLYVRDDKAVPFFESKGISYKQNVDMAVYMQPKPIEGLELPPKAVFININGMMYLNSYATLAGKFPNYKDFIDKIIEKFLNKGIEIVLVPHTYDAEHPIGEDDLTAIKLIKRNISTDTLKIIDKNYTASEIKYIISKADFFIGSRMHSCIAALSNSVPTIGASYSYKFKGTFAQFQQQDNVIELSGNIHVEDYIKKVFTIFDQKEIIRVKLQELNAKREMLYFEK